VTTLIAFTGLPGTGKSTLADKLAAELGAPSFSGDWLLGALKPHGLLTGLDRPTLLAAYYDLLTTLATRQLMLGQSAVLDCLVSNEIGTRWRQLADQYQARLLVVECVCSNEAEHRRRLEGRRRGIPGWHEVGWAHVERMRAEYGRFGEADLVVDAMDPVEVNLGGVRRLLED
jgi:predicted kinase